MLFKYQNNAEYSGINPGEGWNGEKVLVHGKTKFGAITYSHYEITIDHHSNQLLFACSTGIQFPAKFLVVDDSLFVEKLCLMMKEIRQVFYVYFLKKRVFKLIEWDLRQLQTKRETS